MLKAAISAPGVQPKPSAITADGGSVTHDAFTGSGSANIIAANPNFPDMMFLSLANNEQAYSDLSGLESGADYRLEARAYTASPSGVVQIAILDTVSIAVILINNVGDFSADFTAPADTSNLQMHISGDGSQAGLSYLRVVRA